MKKLKLPEFIAYDGYNIPTGKTAKDNEKRRQIITHFYEKWILENGEKKVKNDNLKQFIHVNYSSVKETKNWARLSFRSTLTVLELSYVLKHAVKIGSDTPKGNKKQSRFVDMLMMECIVPKLRPYVATAKLIVGVVKHGGRKLQYCLTAK